MEDSSNIRLIHPLFPLFQFPGLSRKYSNILSREAECSLNNFVSFASHFHDDEEKDERRR